MEKVDYNIEYAHIYANSFDKNKVINAEQRQSVKTTQQLIETLDSENKTYSLNILIDDYNEEAIDLNEDVLFLELEDLNLAPDHIMLESRLANLAENLINNILVRYIDKKSVSEVVFAPKTNDIRLWAPNAGERSFRKMFFDYAEGKIGEDELREKELKKNSATLISKNTFRSKSEIILKYKDRAGVVRYSCPLLTACWHLMRLGVEPFDKGFLNLKSFSTKPFVGRRLITILPSSYLKIEGTAMEIISLLQSESIRKCRYYLEYYFF